MKLQPLPASLRIYSYIPDWICEVQSGWVNRARYTTSAVAPDTLRRLWCMRCLGCQRNWSEAQLP